MGLNPNNIIGYPSNKVMLADVLTRKIQESKPDLIGFGGLCTDYAFLRDAIAITRAATKAPIVLGGQIVTNDTEFICNDLQPDYAVVGDGESAIVSIANAETPKGSIVQAMPNINCLPFPDYEPFGVRDMMDNHSMDTRLLYRYPRADPRPFIIVASRGCPFSCSFCIHGHREQPYRARSIDGIMDEIKETYERYHYNILIILDELFAVNKRRMTEFCEAIIHGKAVYGWDFDWMFQTHASARLDLESLNRAKRAGCFFFSYGLESAAPRVLASMNKKIQVGQVIEAIQLAKQAQIGFGANLIFGDPAETEETWAESLAFWLKYGRDAFIFLTELRPYPGSKIFNDCMARGIVPDKKQYYENIDRVMTNLTTIPNHKYTALLEMTMRLEQSWLFAPQASLVSVRQIQGRVCEMKLICPNCSEQSTYRENVFVPGKAITLGTGCTHCNQRLRVDIPA